MIPPSGQKPSRLPDDPSRCRSDHGLCSYTTGWGHYPWQPFPAQLGRVDAEIDLRARAHAILGVSPGASTQEIRAAWLKLVKDLHPEGWSSLNTPASERLKAINQAYQTLKSPERHATQRRAARGSLHNRSLPADCL